VNFLGYWKSHRFLIYLWIKNRVCILFS